VNSLSTLARARNASRLSIELLTAALLVLLTTADLRAEDTPALRLETDASTFSLDADGRITSIFCKSTGKNYVPSAQAAPLLSVRLKGKVHPPSKARWNQQEGRLTLEYADARVRAVVAASAKSTHVVFELLQVDQSDRVEAALWGPYPTTIREIIGETVGVVRDREFAIGIQALNVKTLGGYPAHENDSEAEFSADDRGQYQDLPAELLKGQHFRGDTARPAEFGSVLQAYSRDRRQERVAANWGHPKYRIPPLQDGGVAGSKIALFACPADKALETIGAIERAEGLPHPMIDGVWGKMSPGATASYLIVDFSEANIERAVEMTRRAGLRYLYHSSPFETWGHFKLKPSLFPNGWDGMRTCVEKAKGGGVRVGVHMLSNFITPNDAYVTPQPDSRLAWIGASKLAGDIDESLKEVPVLDPDYFARKSALNTVRIGAELIRYSTVSTQAPVRLLECERGAWGTRATAHAKGASVARLLDHEYKVFLSDADLSQEIARHLAALFNHAGLMQTSFDGLEGNWSTGYGKYGCALFTKAWFDALDPSLRGQVINDASLPGHFNWHINTRMNWGEPWYGGFRESQTLYRFRNQVYFERNLMPRMLGWFALRPDTSIEDAEWLLARAAGFNAGFALATSLASTAQLAADPASADTAKRYGATPAILESIRQWETARMAGVFPAELKSAFRDNAREFHLEPAGPGKWTVQEVHLARFTHDASQAAATEFQYAGASPEQSLQWIVRASSKAPVTGLRLAIAGAAVADLKDVTIPAGGSLKYAGGTEAVIADAKWTEVARITVPQSANGPAGMFRIECAPQDGASLKMELRTLDAPIAIGK
jgi:hypothetical protein